MRVPLHQGCLVARGLDGVIRSGRTLRHPRILVCGTLLDL